MAASNRKEHLARPRLSLSPLANTINCLPGSQTLLKVTHDHSLAGSLCYCLFAPHNINMWVSLLEFSVGQIFLSALTPPCTPSQPAPWMHFFCTKPAPVWKLLITACPKTSEKSLRQKSKQEAAKQAAHSFHWQPKLSHNWSSAVNRLEVIKRKPPFSLLSIEISPFSAQNKTLRSYRVFYFAYKVGIMTSALIQIRFSLVLTSWVVSIVLSIYTGCLTEIFLI